MKHLKKVLLLTFALAVIVSIFMMTEITSSATTYSGTCGDNVNWSLDTETGVLKISGTGNMYNYYINNNLSGKLNIRVGSSPWISQDTYNVIKTVVIEESVTNIGEYSFTGCISLKSMTIPDSVTTIGFEAFTKCTSLTSITIPDSVTSIGDYAFNSCSSLTSITIPDSVTSIGDYAFNSCSSLTSVTIPDSITNIDNGVFSGCTSLTNVTIPDSVTSISVNAFDNCTSLTSITVDKNNQHYVSLDGVLYDSNCTTLILYPKGISRTSFMIPDSVTSIGSSAFSRCTSLTSMTIPDSVTSIGSAAFSRCTSLISMTIPDSVTSIGRSAFYNCTSLTSMTIPDSVTSVGDSTFYNCTSLTNITFSNSATGIESDTFKNCTSLESVIIGNSVTEIYDNAFRGCTALKSVTIPGSVKHINYDAFKGCSGLTNLYISDIAAWCDISFGIYSNPMYYAKNVYLNGELITELVIPGSVTSIGSRDFAYWDSITSVIVSDSVTSIGDYAFYDCAYLTSITIPESVTEISDTAFDDSPVTIKCYENSYAHLYAAKNRISFQIIEKHTYTDYIYNNDATCTADGTKTAYCNCGCGLTDTVTAENTKVEHSFGDYTYNNDATCTSDATMTATCLYGCGTVDVKIVEGTKKEHNYTPQLLATPTCTASGKILYLCTCGYNYIEEVPMLEHKYGEWTVLLMPTQNTVGFEERKCSVCSTTEQRVIPVLEYVNPFNDVKESHWFYSSVEFVVKKGYMKGMSDTTFSPNSNITREQFVLILANIAGVDTNEFKTVSSGFADVPTGQWYSGAVTWAVREGYVSGMSADKFGRGQSIQRAALARMLYNYASKNGINVDGRADLSAFGDAKEFDKAGNAWMVEPIQWAVDAGIISGMNVNGKLSVNPKGTATRAQAAVMLMKFDELLK